MVIRSLLAAFAWMDPDYDATKFIVKCLQLPRSIDAINKRAGTSRGVYYQNADILCKLYKLGYVLTTYKLLVYGT
ncbi:hypothetical protein EYZ11_006150 [Aspergillus tanneri]|uniref:Uncharacterized protein n=1 Tax=Aspergillus tanneri TaxID=1220188 RepID=A0A4S3JGG7_9EURO|nr:hypothetical protein EYZ11_006150 [Aspergillus tanneri]